MSESTQKNDPPWYSQAFMRGEKYALDAAEERIRALEPPENFFVYTEAEPLFAVAWRAGLDAALAALRDREVKP